MNSLVVKKYEALPDDLQKEVIDFIEFLALKYQKQIAEHESLSKQRASLFGNAKGLMTILPGFDDIPDGFDDYK